MNPRWGVRRSTPDDRLRDVIEAFVALSAGEKAELIIRSPGLFFAVARLVRRYDAR